MATYTNKLNLKKPGQNDFYNVEDANANMDKIDEALGVEIATLDGTGSVPANQLGNAPKLDSVYEISNFQEFKDALEDNSLDLKNIIVTQPLEMTSSTTINVHGTIQFLSKQLIFQGSGTLTFSGSTSIFVREFSIWSSMNFHFTDQYSRFVVDKFEYVGNVAITFGLSGASKIEGGGFYYREVEKSNPSVSATGDLFRLSKIYEVTNFDEFKQAIEDSPPEEYSVTYKTIIISDRIFIPSNATINIGRMIVDVIGSNIRFQHESGDCNLNLSGNDGFINFDSVLFDFTSQTLNLNITGNYSIISIRNMFTLGNINVIASGTGGLLKYEDIITNQGNVTGDIEQTNTKLNQHVGATGNAHGVVTTSVNGFMSAADKTKLNGVQAGAQVNSVTSVAGKTGTVSLVKADVGLSNVDNLSAASIRSGTTKADVGLGSVLNYGIATQAEAEAGTSSTKYMTPQRVADRAVRTRVYNGGLQYYDEGTWKDVGGSVVKSIQRGLMSSEVTHNSTHNVTISSVDTNKSILLLFNSHHRTLMENNASGITASLSNATTITFRTQTSTSTLSRDYNPSISAAVAWQVIEYN